MGSITAGSIAALAAVAAADPLLLTKAPILADDTAQHMTTTVQDVRPRPTQRGANLDGSLRAGSGFGWALQGDPFNRGPGMGVSRTLGSVDLATGSYARFAVDLSLPAPGFRWTVGRTYSAVQTGNGTNHHDSDGYQGRGWFQTSQPQLQFHDGTTNDEDLLYIVYGADRFLEFQRTGVSSTVFRGVNGTAGLVDEVPGTPNLFVYYDQHGTKTTFFGDNSSPYEAADWQMWKIEDPAGNLAYVGDDSDAEDAVDFGFDASGRIELAYDTAGRRYTYGYTTIDGDARLTSVTADRWNGAAWVAVQSVAYAYYHTGDGTYGDPGCLKTVAVTTPTTDGFSSVATTYYRYWKGAYDSGSNPGHAYAIKYVVDPEGYRRADIAGDPTTMDDATIKSYASSYFTYYDASDRRVWTTWQNGQCGCSGGPNGEHTLIYTENGGYSDTSGSYDEEWRWQVEIERPDGTYLTQYFDEAGQPLSSVITEGDPSSAPGTTWMTAVTRGSEGEVDEVRTPAAVDNYDYSDGTFDAITGLYYSRVLGAADTDLARFESGRQETTSGTVDVQAREYTSTTLTVDGETLKRPLISYTRAYKTDVAYDQTSMGYTYHSSAAALMPKVVTTTLPVVSTATNGSNAANTRKSFLRADGTQAFALREDGVYTYSQYENGQLVKRIEDAQTNHGSDFDSGDDPSTDFGITEDGNGLRRITTYTYDHQGRLETTTRPDGRVIQNYYSVLADGRLVSVSIPKADSGTFYGPASYTVRNLAGQVEAQGTIALSGGTTMTALTGWIDEAEDDPVAAVLVGSLASLTVNILDDTGTRVLETRSYFDIPSPLPGNDSDNFDATVYGYDDMGRRWRTKSANSTITRQRFDAKGRVYEVLIGTNDNAIPEGGGEPSGPNDMVIVEAIAYDMNSNVTSRTRYTAGSLAGPRATTYTYDARNRLLVEERPETPHAAHAYDNLGRRTATAMYTSLASYDPASDLPTTEASGRASLTETSYDEMGRAWKTVRHEVNQSNGALGSSLTSQRWYDAAGREVKSSGGRITKTEYDRIGRAVRVATVAKTDDSGYTDADDVTGDHLLNERISLYAADSDNVLATVSIDRFHDDDISTGTTGRLDTNADADDLLVTAANLEGRAQITAMWHDALDRVTDTVRYGTYNGANWDRDGLSVPARSDTALVTSYVYDDAGRRKDVTDPMGRTARTLYDDAGRTIATVSNYIDGTPSSATGDDDLYIRFDYTDGLKTHHWVDIDGDGVKDGGVDQVTTYTYGVNVAGGSGFARGDLLWKVQYPESSGGSDVVTFAYNAQGQLVSRTDQAGTQIDTAYDDAGRKTSESASALGSGIDGAVRKIGWQYDTQGRVSAVAQMDSTGVHPTTLDQLKYAYDDWGNVNSFRQDPDGLVGAAFSQNDIGIRATYARAAPSGGWETLRQTEWNLNYYTTELSEVTYEYLSSGGLADDSVSRVSRVKLASTVVAEYDYLGTGSVVGIEYPQVDMMANRFGASAGTYPDMDRFNRLTTDRWTKDLSTDRDVYLVDLSYDRNSNITWVEDGVYAGRDVLYTMDGQNRVTSADEGTRSGASVTSRTRKELWTLTQAGNWSNHKLDLDGNGSYAGTGEMDDSGTFNLANELTDRNTDSSGGVECTLTYDAAGNLTDDDEDYEYVYDAWGRLRQVKNQSSALVAEYRYNGLGYRIAWHDDADGDTDVDGSDPWYYIAYDNHWRAVATFRGADQYPKELYVPHAVGRGLDGVILRDKDADTPWIDETDDTDVREQRYYYLQNWRGDVVKLINAASGGKQGEAVRYSAYGVPFLIPTADLDGDGDIQLDDIDYMDDMVNSIEPYSIVGDLDLDGDVDASDALLVAGAVTGRGVLSEVGNRRGYAGYEHDAAIDSLCHVRHRVYLAELGRWTRRDPLGYVDGMSLYGYVGARPMTGTDPMGLVRWPVNEGGSPGGNVPDTRPVKLGDDPGGGGGTGPCIWAPNDPDPPPVCGPGACGTCIEKDTACVWHNKEIFVVAPTCWLAYIAGSPASVTAERLLVPPLGCDYPAVRTRTSCGFDTGAHPTCPHVPGGSCQWTGAVTTRYRTFTVPVSDSISYFDPLSGVPLCIMIVTFNAECQELQFEGPGCCP